MATVFASAVAEEKEEEEKRDTAGAVGAAATG